MALSQATVLIVDDEELNREGLARRLQRQDYEVALAKNGREAIELLALRGNRTYSKLGQNVLQLLIN